MPIPSELDLSSAAAYNARHAPDLEPDSETVARLVAYWQAGHELDVDGKFGPGTRASAGAVEPAPVVAPPAVALPPSLVDRRAQASKDHVYGRRPWSKVTGITLHQTACLLGERDGRWDGVGCHVGVTRSGKVLWLHDFDDLVVHGNGWNAQTVGIEIDGLYAGIDGGDSTVWDDPSTARRETGMTPTPEAMESTRAVIRWIVAEVAHRGGKVGALVAHRQSSGTRRNDPGSAIWQAVALPLHAELGLSDGGPGFKIGKGKPIPEAWDPSRTGIKY